MEMQRLFYELFSSHRATVAKLVPGTEFFFCPCPAPCPSTLRAYAGLMGCTSIFTGANEVKKEHRGKAGWKFPAILATPTQSQITPLATVFLL